MKLEKNLKNLCKESGDIEVVSVDLSVMTVDVILPYDSSLIGLDIEGDTDEERTESFKECVNYRLQQMIDHLEDCKLD